jgi:hypothetical protein
MNKLLVDYCKSRLSDANYKPEYKEVTNASFAKFIVDVAKCIDDIREYDLLPFGTTNYEYEYKITSEDLTAMMDDGIKAILSEDVSQKDKEDGAEKIRNAAYCGLKSAALLLGVHSICDVRSKKDIELGSILLNDVAEPFKFTKQGCALAQKMLDLYYAKYPAPYTDVDEKVIEKYSSAFYVKNGKLEKAELIGDLLEAKVIGSIRILSYYYEKTIEIFDRDDKIDVYCVPYLPFWYVLHCIHEKVGAERMNELAGVRLCDEEQTEDSLPPVILREEPLEDSNGLTQVICENTYIDYHEQYVFFEETNENKLSYNVKDDDSWTVYIPKDWDIKSIRIQRDLTKYVNNILPKIAENFFPDFYKGLLDECKLPKGTCKIALVGNGSRNENEEGGVDLTIPFQMIKLPDMFLGPLMLGSYIIEGSISEKRLKRIRDFEMNGYTTGYADYKLGTSKYKRDFLVDKYGRVLFKTIIEE